MYSESREAAAGNLAQATARHALRSLARGRGYRHALARRTPCSRRGESHGLTWPWPSETTRHPIRSPSSGAFTTPPGPPRASATYCLRTCRQLLSSAKSWPRCYSARAAPMSPPNGASPPGNGEGRPPAVTRIAALKLVAPQPPQTPPPPLRARPCAVYARAPAFAGHLTLSASLRGGAQPLSTSTASACPPAASPSSPRRGPAAPGHPPGLGEGGVSTEATQWAIEQAPVSGSLFAVLVCLGWKADEVGEGAYPRYRPWQRGPGRLTGRCGAICAPWKPRP